MTAATIDGLALGIDLDLSTPVRELVRRVRETGRGVVLGDDGGEVAVVLSVSAFERLQAAATQTDLQRAVEEAEAEVTEGRLVENDEVMDQLRRWADE